MFLIWARLVSRLIQTGPVWRYWVSTINSFNPNLLVSAEICLGQPLVHVVMNYTDGHCRRLVWRLKLLVLRTNTGLESALVCSSLFTHCLHMFFWALRSFLNHSVHEMNHINRRALTGHFEPADQLTRQRVSLSVKDSVASSLPLTGLPSLTAVTVPRSWSSIVQHLYFSC